MHAGVAILPGIDPVAVSMLQSLTVVTTADLLRANTGRVLAAVAGIDQAILRRWIGFAELLDVEEITPAIASAAQASGAESLDTFVSRPLATLRSIAANAAASVSDDALIGLVRDALCVSLGSVLNGTLIHASGAPAAGIPIAAAGRRMTTDAHGRFRMVALAPNPLSVVAFPAPGRVKRFDRVRVAHYSAREGQILKLPARLSRSRTLSQLRGESLPPLGSAPISARVQTTAPQSHDVLQVVERMASGDWRLVSRYLDFADDRFVARIYRIAPAELPSGIAIGDEVSGGPGAYLPVKLCKAGRELRARLIAARTAAASPGPITEPAIRAILARINRRR